ncbi:MAG: hypothetical protein WD009_04295 [Phycisphaeraceae bacterium]
MLLLAACSDEVRDSNYRYSVSILRNDRDHAEPEHVELIDDAIALLEARQLPEDPVLYAAYAAQVNDDRMLIVRYVTPENRGGRIFVRTEGADQLVINDPVEPIRRGLLFTQDRIIDESTIRVTLGRQVRDVIGDELWLDIAEQRSNVITIEPHPNAWPADELPTPDE